MIFISSPGILPILKQKVMGPDWQNIFLELKICKNPDTQYS